MDTTAPSDLLLALAERVDRGATFSEALTEEASEPHYGEFRLVVRDLADRSRRGLTLRQLFGEYPAYFPSRVVSKLAEADAEGSVSNKFRQAATLLGATHEPERGVTRWLGAFSWPKRLFLGAVAVAGVITALWGAFKAVDEARARYDKWRDEPTELVVTPTLGLQVWQNGAQRDMSIEGDENDDGPTVVEVSMAQSPLELRVPKLPHGVGIAITAWKDRSIFSVVEGPEERTPFLHPATGLADYQFGSGKLALWNRAHNYFIGDRLQPASDKYEAIYVSRLERLVSDPACHKPGECQLEWKTTDLERRGNADDVFLAAYIDRDRDRVIDPGEYEYLHLVF